MCSPFLAQVQVDRQWSIPTNAQTSRGPFSTVAETWGRGLIFWLWNNLNRLLSMVRLGLLSRVQLFATLWTVACQAPLSMEFFRHDYWSGLPFPSPGDLPTPGTEPKSPVSPALQVDSLPLSHQGSPDFSTYGKSVHVCTNMDFSVHVYFTLSQHPFEGGSREEVHKETDFPHSETDLCNSWRCVFCFWLQVIITSHTLNKAFL